MNNDLNKKTQEYYSYSRQEMLEFIPENCRKFLDVGCGGGYFGCAVKDKLPDAEVHGIELNKDACIEAERNLDKVINSDINEALNHIEDNFYDCISFNDVLEHFADPVDVLIKIKPKLAKNGIILTSIPNVRYFEVVKDLILHKKWTYKDAGILDYTHLRFFTEKSIPELFEPAGYNVCSINGLNKNRFGLGFKALNFLLRGNLNDMKYLQFACVAKVKENPNG